MPEQTPPQPGAEPCPISLDDLVTAIESGDAQRCSGWLDTTSSSDAVHALARLRDEQRARLFVLLPAGEAAEIIDQIPRSQAIDVLETIDASTAAGIIGELASDDRADLVTQINQSDADRIIDALDEHIASDLQRLVSYEPDSAGGLMVTEYLAFREDQTIRDVLEDLEHHGEKYAKFNVQYTYIVDHEHRLLGVLPIRRLLLRPRLARLRDVMIPNPVRAMDTMKLREINDIFAEHPYLGLPVVSPEDRLIGVIEYAAVEHAAAEASDQMYRQSQGIVGGEELRSMPLLLRSRRRLAWLSTNILLNILAASVIAFHQDTLEAVIALAVFLPIISDMSGCSGNQAVGVSVRELTLGVARPRDVLRVVFKEAAVGLINGLALGVLIGLAAYLWKGNIFLGGVVGLALMINTVIAVIVGGSVPLVLKGFRLDPALASGPILTTITDLCGFLLVLTMASAMMAHLV